MGSPRGNSVNPEYEGIIGVEITEIDPKRGLLMEFFYFVPSNGRIRTFIDRGEKIEEISLKNKIHEYPMIQHLIQVYDLSHVTLTAPRLRKLKEAGLDKILTHQS